MYRASGARWPGIAIDPEVNSKLKKLLMYGKRNLKTVRALA